MILLFLKNNWRGILIALLVCSLGWVVNDYLGQRSVIATQGETITQQTSTITAQVAKIGTFEEAAASAEKNRHAAELARLAVISSLTNQIGTLRKQQPPTDCKQAVDWAVQNKGDLSW